MPRIRLDKETVRAMRVAFFDDGQMLKDIAARFGSTKPTVADVVTFRSWPNVLHHGVRYSFHNRPVRRRKPKLGTPRSRCACGVFVPTGSTICERCFEVEGFRVAPSAHEYIEIPAFLRRGAD